MSLLSELLSINETTTAGSIAAVPGGSQLTPLSKKQKRMLMKTLTGYKRLKGLGEAREDVTDVLDIQTKLDNADNTKTLKRSELAVFGLLDADDRVVRVTILKKDAVKFEKALGLMLGKLDGGVDSIEIAELIFTLKDNFEIVDVNWGVVDGDEEEEEGDAVEGDDSDEDMDADADVEGDDIEGAGDDIEGDVPASGEDPEVKSALSAVIDMMKADAEARKAEAEAEAAKYSAETARAKIAQDEEVSDMEEYNKKKKEAEAEEKKIAQLAQYKQDLENDSAPEVEEPVEPTIPAEEEEEVVKKPARKKKAKTTRAKTLSKVDLAAMILKRLK